ncbi:tRNA (adenine-N(1))-methyltransferase [Lysinibacillus sphaericus]|uniref:Cytoplasmic protein n=2 Tax=Lysinibacillus TaxID=400634 RepID=A0A2S0JYP9_LYSSH|nr:MULTISPECIES: tRNA (adenine(22)-N(1))-methyltransferase TrmK [Lysinibacillus]AHN22516.1 SAM-dependent methyltransferase [Lysinibacillus varians]AVK96221.1 SAM-dependent methyltransferase [Lysinibacillus sphaericus]MCS1382007.1 tRNA (adenine(22)-N(1))-methyltransferase TrmK [Lysinibacillus sphaericus]MED4544493.1 tRNA (adenine(22)-N(1))-methyltransferase TrmK [Lysinibacillus sphaericus]TKI18101.1 tRNA (adenine-N(1))-methyltransferase [Lysinibacillus sphaericus]
MNAQKLSKRLETVAKFVPTGAVVADIGSDHAYLPCYLIHKGIAASAVAGEVVKGPYESALGQVKKEGLTEKITVRLADGLAAVEATDHVDTVTIAGMGGPLIVSILEKHPQSLQGVTRLILQPNIHAKVIREWALTNNWAILDEDILEEDEKIYEILVLQRGAMTLSPSEILFGPKLLLRKAPAFLKKWQREKENWQRVLQSIEGAEPTLEIEEKRAELTALLDLVEGVL